MLDFEFSGAGALVIVEDVFITNLHDTPLWGLMSSPSNGRAEMEPRRRIRKHQSGRRMSMGHRRRACACPVVSCRPRQRLCGVVRYVRLRRARGRPCVGALRQPLDGLWPEFALRAGPDGQADVAGGKFDRFAVGRGDQVVERLALCTGYEVVLGGHQIEHRAGDALEVDDMAANRKLVLDEQILLIEIFHELPVHFAGHGDVVVEPCLHREIVVDESLVVGVLDQSR